MELSCVPCDLSASSKKLKYSVHKCSSFAPNYGPEHILHDKPHDQGSRWSSGTNHHPQYLILKLDSPALLESITFGKFEKTHVCNLKKFKLYVGMEESCRIEVMEACLKNDIHPETLICKPLIANCHVPCQFIKIELLLCWGPSFNFTIWYVQLNGNSDPNSVEPALRWFQQYEQKEIVRLCLKHFRKRNYLNSFRELSKETGVLLEDPNMTKIYELLVERGSYEQLENLLSHRAQSDGCFDEYLLGRDYKATWTPLSENSALKPGMRGGHQMCIDPQNEMVYLLGGWDGNQDLSDFWAYHVPTAAWILISSDVGKEGGPSPRSCHKMCIDPERGQLFVLGRYLDTQYISQDALRNDFYMYDIQSGVWTQITEDTAAMGGPQILFDHQMIMDVSKRTLYVFGGRVLTMPFWPSEEGGPNSNVTEMKFSGLFSYQVATNTWTKLLEDFAQVFQNPGMRSVMARGGHSMLFHTINRNIYAYGGQRGKEYLNDMIIYNVDSSELRYIEQTGKQAWGDFCAPSPGFTQRATIDPDRNEIFVLSGLSKDKDKRDENAQYSIWVFSLITEKWTCIYKNENSGEQYWSKMKNSEPCPRFAHQFVYDPVSKVHYLFGGNPGRVSNPKLRLNDFWKLDLIKPGPQYMINTFKFLIRKYRFMELAQTDSLAALEYLQTQVSDIIDHQNLQQTKEALTEVLFRTSDTSIVERKTKHEIRVELFEKLVSYFPKEMTQPQTDLLDLLTWPLNGD